MHEARTWMIDEHWLYIHIKCSCSLVLIDYEFYRNKLFLSLNYQSIQWHYKWCIFHVQMHMTFPELMCLILHPKSIKLYCWNKKKLMDFFSIIRQINLKTRFAVFLGSRRNSNISIWEWNQLFWHCWGLCSWKVS